MNGTATKDNSNWVVALSPGETATLLTNQKYVDGNIILNVSPSTTPTIHSGTSDPTSATGNNGDLYIKLIV